MNLPRKSIFGLLFLAAPSFGQGFPTFDYNSYEVKSIEPGSRAIVRSAGRDFLCDLLSNQDAGFVEVMLCLPFVSGKEADARETEAKAREAATNAAASTARASAEKAAATELAAKTEQLLSEIGVSSLEQVKEVIVELAAANHCELTVGLVNFYADADLVPVAYAMKLPKDMSKPQLDAFRAIAREAVDSLYHEEKIVYVERETVIKIKDCN